MTGAKSTSQISPPDLARRAYGAMELYAPNRKPCAIDLSDNTNLAGLPPSAKKEIEAASSSTFTRYPSLYGGELKRAIGDYLGVSPEHVVTGCGSDDILDSAIRAFTEPGDAIAFADPTFTMLPSFASMNSLEARSIALVGGSFDIDAERLVEAGAKVTYVCSPNNPTGTLASKSALDHTIQRARGVVIVDEAYIEYARDTESLAARATQEDRLLVVRTLSKAFGLAGMRVGYAVGSRELVRAVEKSRGPYKVTALAEKMATSALDHDREWVDASIRDVLESRERMESFFRERGLVPLPSSANFLLVPVGEPRKDKSRDAMELAQKLREHGVGVRPFPGATGIGDALRISVGPWSLMAQTLAAFQEVLG